MPRKFNPLTPPFDYYEEDEKNLKVSSNDTTPANLENKIVAGTGATITTLNDGGNETLEIAVAPGSGSPGGVNTDVQYNNSGVFGGSSAMQYDSGNSRFKQTTDHDFDGYKSIAMACDNGTAFPASPSTAQWFYRSDIDCLFLYEGVWKPITSFAALNLYVDGTSGSDAAGKGYGTGANATASIAYAVNLIPPIFGGNVVVNIAAGTYSERVAVVGKAATGNFTITFRGVIPTAYESGIATSGGNYAINGPGLGWTAASLTDSTKSWTTDQHSESLLLITGGTGAGQERFIRENTATRLDVIGAWDTTPDNTSTYEIIDMRTGSTTLTPGGYTGTEPDLDFNNQKSCIVEYIYFLDSQRYAMRSHDFSSLSVRACLFEQSRASGQATQGFISVDSYGSLPYAIDCLFVESSGTRMASAIRYILAASADSAFSIRRIWVKNGTRGMVIAGALINSGLGGNQLLVENSRVEGINVQGYSRFNMEASVITGSQGVGVGIESSELLFRRNCIIENSASHGVQVNQGGTYWAVGAGGTAQIDNNGGWGVIAVQGGNLKEPTAFTYNGNTLGTFIDGNSVTLGSETTNVGNVGGGEDDLMTVSLAADALGTGGDVLDFDMVFNTASNLNAKTIKVHIGAVEIFTTGAQALNAESVRIQGRIQRLTATTGLAWTNASSTGGLLAGAGSIVAANVNYAGALTLKATGQGNTTNDVVQRTLLARRIAPLLVP